MTNETIAADHSRTTPKPAYTARGNWMPSIPNQRCEECGTTYTAHKKDQRFCGRSCAQKSTMRKTAPPHTERTCPGCGTKWHGAPSNSSRYCSKECIFESDQWAHPIDRDCEECGTAFKARRRRARDQWMRFCSHSCAAANATLPLDDRVCAHCGGPFSIRPTRTDATCSAECKSAFFTRDRHHAWTGGLVDQNTRLSRRIDREGYASKYEGEHRLIAAREIGRALVRGECVLCIDKDNSNIAPSNLFLCPSQKERGLIQSGAVDWPKSSNLSAYRSNGYNRPDVIVVLHEWKNGKRPGRGSGKHMITRHPQADEIIKRRRAGASLADLAKAFETAKSAMAETIRSRL